MTPDPSRGYEAIAHRFLAQRSETGAATIQKWCRGLPAGASVLDLGCGSGVPITEAIIEAGCVVHGVDASPTLVAVFQRRFPQVSVVCEAVETSAFFGQQYDGIVAVGLVFLLEPDVQCALIRRVATALKPGGRFLFTAPVQEGTWSDLLTGLQSVSLGHAAYLRALSEAGLDVVGEYLDEGGNHYYDAAVILRK